MGTEITFRRGSNDPTSGSGITLAEPVFNTTLKTFHIGLGHGVTAAWVGAPISGLSADIAAGITYKTPTAKAVKDYVTAVGGSSITDYVISFNGLTGSVTGVTVGGANVFTALNSFNAGICASGITLSSGIITAPGAGIYLTSSNTKNAKINLLGGPSSSQVELDAITVRVRNTTDGTLPTLELYEDTDVYSAKLQYAASSSNDATITFPAFTGTVALTNRVVTSFNGLTGAVTGVTVGGANTFTALNTFSAGISTSTLTVSGGTTFTGNIAAPNIVNSVVAGTGISVSGATGAVTITNTGVQTVNGLTGAIINVGLTSGKLSQFASTTSAELASIISNETGTGVLVFGTSPAITTSITTGSATFALVNTVATTLNFGGAATALTMGATSGTAAIRNPTLTLGNTNATITTGSGTTNYLSISPYGNVLLQPTTTAFGFGTITSVAVTNAVDAVGQVQIAGGDLYLGVKSTDGIDSLPVNIIFEGATDDGFETTLTVVDPTADNTISLPNISGTIALTSQLMGAINGSTAATTAVTSFNGLTGAVQGVSAAVAGTGISVSGATGAVTITNTGVTSAVAGTGISVSAATGSVTITNTGVQSFNGLTGAVLADAVTWSVITADQTAVINKGYFANKGTLLTLTLPTTAAVGSVIRVSGMNAGLWKIAQNASEVIHFGKTDTTVGTGGYIESTLARDAVELICCVADTEWNVVSSVGNITIV